MLAVPLPLVPMAASLVRPPFHRDGWLYEQKGRRLARRRLRGISRYLEAPYVSGGFEDRAGRGASRNQLPLVVPCLSLAERKRARPTDHGAVRLQQPGRCSTHKLYLKVGGREVLGVVQQAVRRPSHDVVEQSGKRARRRRDRPFAGTLLATSRAFWGDIRVRGGGRDAAVAARGEWR